VPVVATVDVLEAEAQPVAVELSDDATAAIAAPPIRAAEPALPEPLPPVLERPAAAAAPRPPAVRMDPAETARLRARGDELLRPHDVAAARLFFMRAADGGDAASAVAAGKTFDPAFLRRTGAIGLNGDLGQAAFWYARARDLGNEEAAGLLRSLPPG
jgi:TPR repeat protein